ncbi:MAG: aldo/keto reductase [Sedimentisphaerales bacterium]|nr:aldo/keto reductase [Sedimentisphaerales bacterium]
MKNIKWNGERISGIVLGTAQLGMNYGIANVHGQPDEGLACEIVKTSLGYGINCFDTAAVYGNSEIVLGRALKYCKARADVKIASKLSPDLQPTDWNALEQSIKDSCRNLGVERLWCLMLHKGDWLNIWDEGLGRFLSGVVKRGLVKYLGVSTYWTDEAYRALENPQIQIIQVPCNAWDQRMKASDVFELAKSLNKLCFVRSIYLQGLLTMPPEAVEKRLSKAAEVSRRWHELAESYDLKPIELAMGFAKSLQWPLVVGVDDTVQMAENLSLFESVELPKEIVEDTRLMVDDEDIVIPMHWDVKKAN